MSFLSRSRALAATSASETCPRVARASATRTITTRERLVDREPRDGRVARSDDAHLAGRVGERAREAPRERELTALEQRRRATLRLEAACWSRTDETLEATHDELRVVMRSAPHDERIPGDGVLAVRERERDGPLARRCVAAPCLGTNDERLEADVVRVLSSRATRKLGGFVGATARERASPLRGERACGRRVALQRDVERAIGQRILRVELAPRLADARHDLGVVLVLVDGHCVRRDGRLEVAALLREDAAQERGVRLGRDVAALDDAAVVDAHDARLGRAARDAASASAAASEDRGRDGRIESASRSRLRPHLRERREEPLVLGVVTDGDAQLRAQPPADLVEAADEDAVAREVLERPSRTGRASSPRGSSRRSASR